MPPYLSIDQLAKITEDFAKKLIKLNQSSRNSCEKSFSEHSHSAAGGAGYRSAVMEHVMLPPRNTSDVAKQLFDAGDADAIAQKQKALKLRPEFSSALDDLLRRLRQALSAIRDAERDSTNNFSASRSEASAKIKQYSKAARAWSKSSSDKKTKPPFQGKSPADVHSFSLE